MKRILLLFCSLALVMQVWAKDGFAIVIDKESYRQAKTEVEAYAQAIEKYNGLKTFIVEDCWGVPDSIRAQLMVMHQAKDCPIRGAVLIGDIPVVMVRDAQHMTSAFKMKQSNPREESSVPSDRFYDDFDLKFDFLDKDADKDYFYYSLRADSRQLLCSDIYTGRIRPSDCNGTSRYEKLRSFLKKAVAEKARQRELKKLFYFSGHGYVSDSKVCRIDEKQAYFEHFPSLRTQRNNISYMDHTDNVPIKQRLMNELMRTDLDFALLHHHGYPDTEYLNGIEPIRTVAAAKEFVVRNIREHIYSAYKKGKNADSISIVLCHKFDVPRSWVADALSDSLARADSVYEAASDLHLEDFQYYGYKPNCPLVMIDACYCGSFHLEDCIANEYIFQSGGTVAVIANTVNSLQDKWSDHLIGLVQQGGVAGDIVRYAGYLESHLMGDPTFHYASNTGLDLDNIILRDKASVWKKLLKSAWPDIQSLALLHLSRQHVLSSADLLNIYETSPYGIVRLQALSNLVAFYNDRNAVKCIALATDDGFELAQRWALRFIQDSGDESLIPSLIRVCISNNTSERVNFDAMAALTAYPQDKLLEEFARQFDSPEVQYIYKDSIRGLIRNSIIYNAKRTETAANETMADDVKDGARNVSLRSMRNNIAHHRIPELLEYFRTKADDKMRIDLMEMLGWHKSSVNAQLIAEMARKVSLDTRYSEEIRNEALKTYNRITAK